MRQDHSNKVAHLETEHELHLKAITDKHIAHVKTLEDANELAAKRDAEKIRTLNSQHRQKVEDMEIKYNASMRAASEEQAILRQQFEEFLDDYEGGG